jgi:hypothetical protein
MAEKTIDQEAEEWGSDPAATPGPEGQAHHPRRPGGIPAEDDDHGAPDNRSLVEKARDAIAGGEERDREDYHLDRKT